MRKSIIVMVLLLSGCGAALDSFLAIKDAINQAIAGVTEVLPDAPVKDTEHEQLHEESTDD